LGPISTSGVARPWTASSAVIVEKAVPSSIARPSRARRPARVSAAAPHAVIPAAATTSAKCTIGAGITMSRPSSATTITGAMASEPSNAGTVQRERSDIGLLIGLLDGELTRLDECRGRRAPLQARAAR
jgi:hypothetical protein